MCLEAVQRFNDSPVRALVLDVATRWDSQYLMLERVREEKEHIRTVLYQEHSGNLDALAAKNLTDTEWRVVDELITIL